MKSLFITFSLAMLMSSGAPHVEPYKNHNLTAEERAEDLLSKLTLDEKIALMQDVSAPVEHLGIPEYNWWNEALHGVANAGVATVFPQCIGMAATFDNEALLRVFEAVSDEARAKFHEARRNGEHERYQGLTFWTPNINIFRDPRWGRGQETYGEDPYLTTCMGLAAVKGLQGPEDSKYDKLHACAKHYAVHSGPEWNRHSFNAENIEPRDLWETYLPAFKALVTEGNVKEVMCAYNRFEGEPCCGNKRLLMQILRDEWKFKGLVVSDCGAIGDFYGKGRHETHATAEAASADAVLSGTDVECGSRYKKLKTAVEQGLISEKQLDVSVRRLLTARFELGEMDPDSCVSWSKITMDTVNCLTHRTLALDMARKSMVLLQNKDNILPLAKNTSKIVVMGPNATDSLMHRGNYYGTAAQTITVLQGICSKLGNVEYVQGCGKVDDIAFESHMNMIKTSAGESGFEATYWNSRNLSGDIVARQIITTPFNFDTGGATVFAPEVNLYNFSAQYKGSYQPQADGKVALVIEGDDGYRIRVNGQEVINYWGEHKSAKREYLLKVEAGEKYDIEIDYMQATGEASLKFDIGEYRAITVREAVEAAGDAEIVIFVGGISAALEGEEMHVNYPGFKKGDRTDIELPAVQRKLIAGLKKAGKKVILVHCSGSAMGLVPETENCEAILQAWYPGQEGGTAVADILFGDYNPSGKLPVTFYRNVNQLPDFQNYSMKGRTYRYMLGKPLFPFGYGLSYTTFSYDKAWVSAEEVKLGDMISLSFTVANTGKCDGDEVVQVYIRRTDDKDGPMKTLRAFRRVSLKAGESKIVRFELESSAFEFFDTNSNVMRTLPGEYEIMYGGNSDDTSLKKLSVVLKDGV